MEPTRREFIVGAAGATASALFASETGAQSANERLGVALIGCGGRGNYILGECLKRRKTRNLEFPAVCDVWKVNLESTAARIEEATGRMPRTFTRYADLLALPEVDCVIIATPDFAHSPILTAAAEAKKHAYVEKPMASRMEDANAALDTVLKNGIVCQVGTQRRSDGMHVAAARLIQSGVLGKMIKCECGWHDNGPRWERDFSDVRQEDVDWEQYLMYLPARKFDARMFRLWHLYKECSVGLVGLLGSHLIDIATWYNDDPLPRYAVGMGENIVWTERENTDTQECLFYYPKGFLLQYSSRLGNSKRGPENVFYGTRGIFDTESWVARGNGGGADKIEEPIKVEPIRAMDHVDNWIRCVHAGNPRTHADIHTGYAHSVASIMGSLACDTGHRMGFDPEARIVKGG